MMKTSWLSLLLLTACGAASAPPSAPAGPPAAFAGSKGVNLHSWFTWPRQRDAGHYMFPAFQNQPGELSAAEAKRVRALGFDFVRLTVEPGVFMAARGAELEQADAALLDGIARLRGAGLSVIVDMHPNTAFQPDPAVPAKGVDAILRGPADPIGRRFQDATATLAGVLDKRYGGTRGVAFELLNEPNLPCGAQRWRMQQAALHRAVRAAAPRLTLILTGTCFSGIDGLTTLRAADYADANTLFTFHFYEDHRFTHQGTGQAGTVPGLTGLPYPWNARDAAAVDTEIAARQAMLPDGGESQRAAAAKSLGVYRAARWDRAAVDRRFDLVSAWAKANGVPPSRILLGEFGVNGGGASSPGARDDDRLRWLTDVRQAAEARGFRWALWRYRAGPGKTDDFDLETDPATGAVDRGMVAALGLKARR